LILEANEMNNKKNKKKIDKKGEKRVLGLD
jgi:hypothetical protein